MAQYLTELSPREVLERKLHDAIRLAREQLAWRVESQEAVARLESPGEPPPSAGKARRSKRGQKKR